MIEVLISVGVIIAGVLGWAIRRLLAKLDGVAAEVAAVKLDVARVKAQFSNNGGSTLRDAVDKLGEKHDKLGEKLSEHLEDAARVDERFKAHLAMHALVPATQVVVQPTPPPQT